MIDLAVLIVGTFGVIIVGAYAVGLIIGVLITVFGRTCYRIVCLFNPEEDAERRRRLELEEIS